MQIESNSLITKENFNLEKFIQSIIKEIKQLEEILVIDRIENKIAICENRNSGKMVEIDMSKLPKEVKEGYILKFNNGIYTVDIEEKNKIEERIKEKMKNIWDN